MEFSNLFIWWKEAPGAARRSLIAASLGWMLDSFDVMLYALVIASLMGDLDLSKSTAGLLGSLTLIASAIGGMAFGIIADRFGRIKALMGSVLIYSIFTAACGLSITVAQLALFRVLLGLGMGGEWASGAALVSETWPSEHRGKALGFMQSFWALGYATAALVSAAILPVWGWRAVFFIGVLPAFFTLWVRRRVEEPEIWKKQADLPQKKTKGNFSQLFRRGTLKITLSLSSMNALTMFAWWGLNLWIPAYLSLASKQGGVGLSSRVMSGMVIFMQVGMWFGYILFGFVSDAFGRKRTYIVYLVAASFLVFAYSKTRNPYLLLVLGPFVAFFGTGYFSGFGALSAELYPTSFRATAQGFTYNIGRIVSAISPFVVGALAQRKGFGLAFPMVSIAFLAAAFIWRWIPETKGKELE